MGCAVNGPGEAGDADFGIAGGRDAGFIYAHGEVLRKVPQAELVDELFREVDAWIAAGMVRPQAQDAQARAAGRQRTARRALAAGASQASKRACFARYASSWDSPNANQSSTNRSSTWVRDGDMLEHRLADRARGIPVLAVSRAPPTVCWLCSQQ